MSAPSELPAASFSVHGLDHVQLAMPPGQEAAARHFYGTVLGLRELPKPPVLARRGGVWFGGGSLRLHLGVEAEFRPARKAHPALLVENLAALVRQLRGAGVEVLTDEPLEGYERVYVADPFGNRIELLEPLPVPLEPLEFRMEEPGGELARSLIAAMCAELSARYDSPPSPLESADLVTPRTGLVVAWWQGAPVGCAALRRFDDETAELKRMYVVPSARRRRVARQLLSETERIARAWGYHRVWLETGTRQPEAIRLYESRGYQRIPAFGFYVGNPFSVCFAKELSESSAQVAAPRAIFSGWLPSPGARAACCFAARQRPLPHLG